MLLHHVIVPQVVASSALMDVLGALLLVRKRGAEWVVLGCILCALALMRLLAVVWGGVCVSLVFVSCVYEIGIACVCVYLDMVSLSMGQRVVCVNVFFVLLVWSDVISQADWWADSSLLSDSNAFFNSNLLSDSNAFSNVNSYSNGLLDDGPQHPPGHLPFLLRALPLTPVL